MFAKSILNLGSLVVLGAFINGCSSPVEKTTYYQGSAVVVHEDPNVTRSESQNKCQVPVRITPEKRPDWAINMAKKNENAKGFYVASARGQSDWNIGIDETRVTAGAEFARSVVDGIVNKARRIVESKGGKAGYASSEFSQQTVAYTENLVSDMNREEVYYEEFECKDNHYWDVYVLYSVPETTKARLVEVVLKKIKDKSTSPEEKAAIKELEGSAKELF